MEAIGLIVPLAIIVVMLAAMWRVSTKAGQPGWGCLIPIYNIYLLILIAGKPGWWLILMFIPLVNAVVSIIVAIAVAEQFGKSVGFGLGLAFMGGIFYPILAFGSATYGGAAAAELPSAYEPASPYEQPPAMR